MNRLLRFVAFLALVLVVAQPAPFAQTKKTAALPRTSDGHPDLQGIWDFRSATPLERPARFAGRKFMTPVEVVEYERLALEREDGRPPDDARSLEEQSVHPVWWLDYGKTVVKTARASLDGRPHGSPNLRAWMGDSRGRWERDTLVVDTTNFTDRTNFRGSGENLHLVERFGRVDAETIDYRFTVEDPTTWTRPWTVASPIVKTDGPIYELACHEGNDGLRDILSGARDEDRIADEAERKRK